MSARITILGAGVAGLTLATELAARGARPTLVDPNGAPGQHGCSWWAGGMLAPFCEGETAEPPVIRLGQEAAAWWQRAGAEVIYAGTLVVALQRDRKELDRFARRTREHVSVRGDSLAELEPALQGRFDRGLLFPTESHLSPRQALGALVAGLEAWGIGIEASARKDPGTVIDCRGLAARDSLPDLRGVRGEMAVLRAPDIQLSRPIRLLHPRHPLYVVPRGDGVYMLGATQIENAHRGPARLRSVVELLNSAYALDPVFAEAEVLELGADARPAFPDNLPRIETRGSTIYLNGLFRHGFLLAPALARRCADLVLDGTSPKDLR